MTLPCVGIFWEIVPPQSLIVAINFRPTEGICPHSANQQRDNGSRGDFDSPLWPSPHERDARGEKRQQRNVCEILVMIRDERAAAHISHSDESERWQERDDKTSNGKKS